jgi:hypothetical protein
MSLREKRSVSPAQCHYVRFLPEQCENGSDNHRQHIYTPMFSLLVDLDQAIQKRRKPQKPFEKSCQHDRANDSGIHDLWVRQDRSAMNFVLWKLTSFTGHGVWSSEGILKRCRENPSIGLHLYYTDLMEVCTSNNGVRSRRYLSCRISNGVGWEIRRLSAVGG